VSASRDTGAPVEVVWGLISDLPRMGEWSNENNGGRWLRGASGPEVGARFRGNNRNGDHFWKTQVRVTEAEPGEKFSFDVTFFGLPISAWSYEVAPTELGCRITETWTDRRFGWFKPVAHLATGVGDRAEHTRKGIEHTLAQLAATAEGLAAG
jgi:uncharacterized protein YndB with AHSA1/START domain